MRLFGELGYDGPFVYDHVPEMVGDSERQEQVGRLCPGIYEGTDEGSGRQPVGTGQDEGPVSERD